ncbi:anaphase-promoting complex subunit 4-like [Salmo salar]|uniref:Anaphase-promoting complex subunit 4-like n=1 Tax=Salmo salar TaxID=8030 RepID=A0ABM3DSS6_SALSA|nr:anaphase-promoting complex subunit 4-like [Salmo salar]
MPVVSSSSTQGCCPAGSLRSPGWHTSSPTSPLCCSMCETWEDILMQMDLWLTKFVQEKNTRTQVQDEFLELLLWGRSSPEPQFSPHESADRQE